MKTLQDHLAAYAGYHRDTRNIATHFVGIPMIVVAIATLLSRPAVEVAGLPVTPALLLAVATGVFYLRLSPALGLLMAALLALALQFAGWAAALPTPAWLAIGGGLFVVGWVFQFVGHAFEGRKPAFVDDLVGLVVGPLFVVVEVLFTCGLLQDLRAAIEGRAGLTRSGHTGSPAAAPRRNGA